MTNTSKEINLIHTLSDFFKYLSRKKVLILVMMTVGLALGCVNYKYSKTVCKNSSIIVSSTESGEILCDILESLVVEDKLILAKQLNISFENAKKIQDITFEVKILNSYLSGYPFQSRIKMDLILDDELDRQFIEKGIKGYLKSNTYLQENLNNYIDRNKEVLKITNDKLLELESKKIFFEGKIDGKQQYIEVVILDLHSRIQQLELLINEASIIQFVSFGDFETVSKPRIFLSLVKFCFLGFAFSLIFGWLFDFYIKVKNV